MPTSIDLIIDRQIRRWDIERHAPRTGDERDLAPARQPVITVSRQHGTSGVKIAAELASRFQYTLLHRDMIDRMCQSTGISRRLFEALDEHSRSEVTIWFDSMLAGKYFGADDYAKALLKVLYTIAELGGVVVVGRGSNFIVGLDRGFHVRITAPREVRIRQLMARKGIFEKEATREVDTCDHERAEFIRKMCHRPADDPLGYDLIVNEAGLSVEGIVGLLETAAREKLERVRSRARTSVG
jgi:cytidylate kinase